VWSAVQGVRAGRAGAVEVAEVGPRRGEDRDDSIRIEPRTRWPEFLDLRREWNDLWARSPQRGNVFLSHEWFRAWWEAFGDRRELLVLGLRSGERLVGLAPLMRYRTRYHGVPVRMLSLITNEHTNRAELILAERHRECVAQLLDYLRRRGATWDMAQFDFLPASSPTAEALREEAAGAGLAWGRKPSYHSPYIPIQGGWEGFWASRPGHFRRNMKNRERRLSALGEVRYQETGECHRPLLEEMFVVGEKSWKGTRTRTAIASTAPLRRFYTRLAELAADRGWLSLHLLRVGGRPIAFHYSLKHDGVVRLLKTEYDLEYGKYSPGHQIQARVLRGCFERGLREFDFLGPRMEWKMEWADRVREHVRLLLFHGGPRSRLLRLLELRAKPMLKRSRLVRRMLTPHED
jgi:CelD/BcsL family acetyltransferase involved in cellulose biosynthesis